MPEDWIEVSLGELTSFASGYSFAPSEQGISAGEFPFYKVSDMNRSGNETSMSDAENWIDQAGLSRLRAKLWPAGTVIFPKVGAALLTEKRRILSRPACFDNNVMGLVPSERLVPEFLLAVMQQVKLADVAQHGAVPSVNQGHLSGIKVLLPPLAVQRCIVDLLSHFDRLLLDLRSEIRACARAKAASLSAALDPSQDGHRVKLGEIVRLNYGKALKSEARENGGIPVFGSAGPTGLHDSALFEGAGVVVGRKGVDSRAEFGTPIRVDQTALACGYKSWGGAGSVRWADGPHWVIDTAYNAVPLTGIRDADLYWLLVNADLPALATLTTLPGLARDAAYSAEVFLPDNLRDVLEPVESLDALQASLYVEMANLVRVRRLLSSALLEGTRDLSEFYSTLMGEVA